MIAMMCIMLSCTVALAKTTHNSLNKSDISSDREHPDVDSNKTQYIIGYGSLMEENSKKRTSPAAGESVPVIVEGFKRGWGIHGPAVDSPTTYLAVIPDEEAEMNAVIYSVTVDEIQKTDRREEGYCRSRVNQEQITFFKNQRIETDSEIWIYTIKEKDRKIANSNFPIVQSYVDIFIKGCLQLQSRFKIDDFAEQCITTTNNWSIHWVNDRIFPRRPFIYESEAKKIDDLLRFTEPSKSYFDKRKIPE